MSFHDRQIGIMFGGRRPLGDIEHWDVSTPDESGWADDFVFLAVNAHWEAHTQELPPLPEGYTWHMFMHTFRKDPFVTEESFDGHTAVIGPAALLYLPASQSRNDPACRILWPDRCTIPENRQNFS